MRYVYLVLEKERDEDPDILAVYSSATKAINSILLDHLRLPSSYLQKPTKVDPDCHAALRRGEMAIFKVDQDSCYQILRQRVR